MDKLKIKSKKKGFTLIEVLIATIIFAVVMIITTSAVTQGVNYENKITAARKSSSESRKLVESLSKDTREANGSFKIAYSENGTTLSSRDFLKGVATFICDSSKTTAKCSQYSFRLKQDVMNGSNSNFSFNTLVLVSSEKVKIYYFPYNSSRTVHYFEYNRSQLKDNGNITDGSDLNLSQIVAGVNSDHTLNLISGESGSWGSSPDSYDGMKTKVTMWGVNPYIGDSANLNNRQPYIGFIVQCETGLDNDDQQHHYKSTVETIISSRSYN